MTEADIILNVVYPPWVSFPCDADGCYSRRAHFPSDHYLVPDDVQDAPQIVVEVDIQNLVTHEVGHFLGLSDLTDRVRHLNMTMITSVDPSNRVEMQKRTLALGDLLGARALYPCDCPLPPVAVP